MGIPGCAGVQIHGPPLPMRNSRLHAYRADSSARFRVLELLMGMEVLLRRLE